MKSTWKKAAIIASIVLAPAIAHAEPSADDRALARTLFDQARAMMKNNDFANAAPKLEESMRLDPGVGTLFNLADTYEHLGRLASAWGAFGTAADLAKRAGQDEREKVARARATALEPKLSKMRVHLAGERPSDLEIRLDGKPFGLAALDLDLPVDSGEHRLRASAAGKLPSEITVKIPSAGEVVPVEIPALTDAPSAPSPVVVGPPPPIGSDRGSGGDWHKPAAIALGAGAVVGLALGAVFALKANSNWSDAKNNGCPNACSNAGYDSWDSSRSSATIGTVGFVAAGVLAAGAVVVYLTAPKGSAARDNVAALLQGGFVSIPSMR